MVACMFSYVIFFNFILLKMKKSEKVSSTMTDPCVASVQESYALYAM